MIEKQDIGKRFLYLRKHFSLNQTEFANNLNITQQTISQIEKGIILPSLEIINIVTSKYCISYEWLIDGVGTMLKEEKNTYIYNSVANENSIENKITNNGLINYTIEKIKDLETKLNNEKKILEILQKRIYK